MAQKQHVIHGRDHAANGADPIPGIGTGGGALEWEDTGIITPAGGINYGVANSGNWLDIRATDAPGIDLIAQAGPLLLQAAGGNTLWLQASGIGIGGYLSIANGIDLLTVILKTGGVVRIQNHLGSDVFQVREDGSVHIKSGTSIIADLPP